MQFDKYAGAPADVDNGIRMPVDRLDAKVSNLCLSEVLGRLERFDDAERARYPWASRFVMGFPLPSWQRPLVWVPEQKVRFIQSIWAGVDLGSYMVNDQYAYVETADKDIFREFSDVLLDGQQRLAAIEQYVFNEFPVPDCEGVLRYWGDLPRIERRRFGSYHFARAAVKSWNEAQLRLAYDLRALGGTPHTEEQRATK